MPLRLSSRFDKKTGRNDHNSVSARGQSLPCEGAGLWRLQALSDGGALKRGQAPFCRMGMTVPSVAASRSMMSSAACWVKGLLIIGAWRKASGSPSRS